MGEHAGAVSKLRGQVDLEAHAGGRGQRLWPVPSVSSQASACPKEANKTLLNDSSCWTIIGTESVQFSFNSSLACTREPVTPVPLVSTLEVRPGARGAEGGAGARARGRRGLLPLLLPPLGPPSPSSAAGATWPRWSSTERTSTRGSRCGSGTWRRRPCTGTGWGGQPPSGRWV